MLNFTKDVVEHQLVNRVNSLPFVYLEKGDVFNYEGKKYTKTSMLGAVLDTGRYKEFKATEFIILPETVFAKMVIEYIINNVLDENEPFGLVVEYSSVENTFRIFIAHDMVGDELYSFIPITEQFYHIIDDLAEQYRRRQGLRYANYMLHPIGIEMDYQVPKDAYNHITGLLESIFNKYAKHKDFARRYYFIDRTGL